MQRLSNRSAAVAVALTVATLPVQSQGTSAVPTIRGHAVAVPSARAVPRDGAVLMDGRLDEAAWQRAQPVTSFTQFDPDEGKPSTERTEVRFLFDDDALYVGARMFDADGPKGVTTRLVRRDASMTSDYFQVVIDAYHDHLGRAFFQVNPSGSKFDALGIGASGPDASWDAVWEAETRIDSLGWIAELRIPLSQLRFSRDPGQTWGLQIRRYIHKRNEDTQWSFWGKNESGGPARFGHLEGVRLNRVSRHAELLPYVVSRSKHVRPAMPGDRFNDGSVQNARAGLDMKYLVTSTMQLSATFNPDFGQVEVDPAVVNLSQYETFFQEKRPFFVEGGGVFGFGSLSCYFCSNVSSIETFYSRRIGRAPTGASLAYGANRNVDMPENSTILGAGKLTGRTKNGITVGLMDAYTRRERAEIYDTLTGELSTQTVEPAANYFVGRAKKDFLNGNLIVGAIGTSLTRSLDTVFSKRLTRHAELVGADVVWFMKQRKYSFISQWAMSNVGGDTLAMQSVQRSAARYLQRPDREPGAFRSAATSLNGLAGYARFAKESGDFLWEGSFNTRTTGYETNDMAFQTRADYRWVNANVYRGWNKPTRWYRSLFTILGAQRSLNWDGDLVDQQYHYMLGGRTKGFWNWDSFVILRPEVLDDRQLRGGPISARPGTGFVQFDLQSDSRKNLSFNVNPGYSWNSEGGWGFSPFAAVRYRPAPNVLVSFSPSYNASSAVQQYVTAVTDPTATAFFGRRYVMSGLNQKTVSFDTRLNVTFSPTMTLELFAQPFIASGHFFDFKEFNAPRSVQKSVYGRDVGTITPTLNAEGRVASYTIDPDSTGPAAAFTIGNPDFNTRSLRGNTVFRWEYRPGSTLFVVWTQSRTGFAPTGVGDFDFGRDREALFSARPDNIFLVKMNFWLAR
jgi:hypothetical protein